MVVTSTRASYNLPMALSEDETRLWHAWKLAGETVMARVTRDLAGATGLSGPDFGVLSRLEDLGGGELRQQELAESMRWDKARLSHHLTRMEERDLVTRRPAPGKGVLVVLTVTGRKLLRTARPEHARAIRAHLVGRLTPDESRRLSAICGKLLEAEGPA